jgi:3-phenylpropionate/trans-cinnamate dioxygenase ferredoxin reductase subunit
VSILIVGASVAGIRTAQALRMQGSTDRITLLGAELHHPYDKPPLSKEMLAREQGPPGADPGPGPVALLTEDELAALDVDLRLGVRATRLDPAARVVETEQSGTFGYDQLVIATGVVPRALPGPVPAGVHTIRTADDALALRTALARTPDVVVIGAGFIGAEFASAARACGCSVTVVEQQPIPMAHILGPEVGGRLAGLHQANGVALRTGVAVSHFEGDQRVSAVVLGTGEVLPAGLVVVGIGARPATDWLASSGLPITDGIECDQNLRVVGFPDVHAAGDVARWPHPHYGFALRVEHWTNANEHGALVAADLLGRPAPPSPVPYVWSDQYGHRIQMAGLANLGRLSRLTGPAANHLVALYADDAGTVVAAVVIDDPRTFMKLRKAVTRRVQADEVEVPDAQLTAPL